MQQYRLVQGKKIEDHLGAKRHSVHPTVKAFDSTNFSIPLFL
jgi:hypothetical protein